MLLNKSHIRRINRAVADVRAGTGATIVPILAGDSGRYDRAETMVGLWAAAMGLALTWMLLSKLPIGKQWSLSGNVWTLGLLPVLAAVLGGFILGSLLATRIGWLKRLFLPRRIMEDSVHQHATHAFYDCYTKFRNLPPCGLVVIYVSLYERATAVIAEDSIREKLLDAEIESIKRAITSGLNRHNVSTKLCQGIALAAKILSRHYPPRAGEKDSPPAKLAILV